MNGITSYKIFLMHKAANASDYSKLVDIKDFPDLGGSPEMLDKTTLSERSRSYLMGIQETEAMSFTTNYNKTDYATVRALKGVEHSFAVWFGGTEAADGTVTPTGSDGKVKFDGYLDVYINGAGVNEVVDMTISISPTGPIDDSDMVS